MKSLKRIVNFLVYSNIWIALGAVSFTLQFYLLTSTRPDPTVLVFIFSATIFTYTFQRFEKIKVRSPAGGDRIDWMNRNMRMVKVILYGSMAAMLFFIFSLSIKALIIISISGLISFFYIRKIPGKIARNLRDLPHLKIYLITIAWTITTVLLPAEMAEKKADQWPLLLMMCHFLYILAITIPFDIRDINLDEEQKKTIPQVVGLPAAKVMATLMAMGSALIIVYGWPDYLLPAVLSSLLTIVLIFFSTPKRNDLYYSFGMDGLLLIQPLLLWLSYYFLI